MRTSLQLFFVLLGFTLPWASHAAVPSDVLIKAGSTAVYYRAADGKRYVFPNQKTYASWFRDFSGIIQVTDAELASFPLGGNVTYRPGVRMIKIQTDPKIYAVAPGGTLRWVVSENVAEDLYGQYWNQAVDDVSDAFFVNYVVGEPIDRADEFLPYQVSEGVDTINAEKGIAVGPAPRRSDTEVANVVDAWREFAFADVNELRRQNGAGPLIMNPLLNRIATIHSKDMAVNLKTLAHDGSMGETAFDRIRFGKVPDVANRTLIFVPHPERIGWTGENVGWTTTERLHDYLDAIQRIHRAFLDEPTDEENHRTTMLSTLHPFAEIGIGIYIAENDSLWLTQDYISIPAQ